MVQSQWRFSTETVEINLNLIGQAKDPDILLDSTHISFNNLIARHRGRQVGLKLDRNESIRNFYYVIDILFRYFRRCI